MKSAKLAKKKKKVCVKKRNPGQLTMLTRYQAVY